MMPFTLTASSQLKSQMNFVTGSHQMRGKGKMKISQRALLLFRLRIFLPEDMKPD